MSRENISKKLVERLDKIFADLAKAKDFDLIGYHVLATGPAIKTYTFKNFEAAANFINDIAKLAYEFSNLPEIKISGEKVTIELYDRNMQALTEDDLHLAIAVEDRYNTLNAAGEE